MSTRRLVLIVITVALALFTGYFAMQRVPGTYCTSVFDKNRPEVASAAGTPIPSSVNQSCGDAGAKSARRTTVAFFAIGVAVLAVVSWQIDERQAGTNGGTAGGT